MRATVAHRTRPVRSQLRRRPLRPMTGQLFEVYVTRDGFLWAVEIPEIDAVLHVDHPADAEAAAAECIAARTGIPVNFVAVWVRD